MTINYTHTHVDLSIHVYNMVWNCTTVSNMSIHRACTKLVRLSTLSIRKHSVHFHTCTPSYTITYQRSVKIKRNKGRKQLLSQTQTYRSIYVCVVKNYAVSQSISKVLLSGNTERE